MKAIVQGRYGSTDVFELREIDEPVVRDGGKGVGFSDTRHGARS
jgi:hypothetical protein